ncbi:c-type cytochrome [Mucilaginibacter boryungensis]|uniref:Cytochrome c n=1 Tax=Mucilaginibacter boryungensis TaxID=768480 RepID=A0ABR9XH27_9SPHI|nr:cytochrome c [Mucilaginibacter boryungensis]MBE9666304.1 cytochrome c [Mucilaginibacter boryungensis]
MKKIYCLLGLLVLVGTTQLYAQAHKTTSKSTVAGLSSSIAAGKKVYTLHCLSCHMADGGGVANMNPPLIGTTYVLGDKNKMIQIVLKGFNEGVEINGDTYTNPMPAQATLTDQEVANVLTYVRNSFGNKASAVKAADVKKIRASLK